MWKFAVVIKRKFELYNNEPVLQLISPLKNDMHLLAYMDRPTKPNIICLDWSFKMLRSWDLFHIKQRKHQQCISKSGCGRAQSNDLQVAIIIMSTKDMVAIIKISRKRNIKDAAVQEVCWERKKISLSKHGSDQSQLQDRSAGLFTFHLRIKYVFIPDTCHWRL